VNQVKCVISIAIMPGSQSQLDPWATWGLTTCGPFTRNSFCIVISCERYN